MIDGWGISYENACRWTSLDLTHDKSTLVQVMACCHQATSRYLSQWCRQATCHKLITWASFDPLPLQWRNNRRDSVSNHQPHDCPLNRLFRRRSKLSVTSLCAGNSPGTGEFPAQMASYTENVSVWWRHHAMVSLGQNELNEIDYEFWVQLIPFRYILWPKSKWSQLRERHWNPCMLHGPWSQWTATRSLISGHW